jgi:hypothetical protein
MSVLMILSATVLLTGAGCWMLWSRSAPPETFHVVRCAHCAQKVRYAARKAGGTGLCPRCLRCLVLPATPQPLATPRLPYRVGERLLPRAEA